MGWVLTRVQRPSPLEGQIMHNLGEHEFIDIMHRMLGTDGFERANREFYDQRGWDASTDTFMKSRLNLLDRAFFQHELGSFTAYADDTKSVRIRWHNDEDGVLFRLKWMKR